MGRTAKIIMIVSSAIALAAILAVYGLFHGDFDPGKYELLSTEWSESRQVAMIAKRSDHQALNGDQIFVLVGDHAFSSAELRHALYGPSIVFSTNRECLSTRWTDAHHLVISCKGEIITDEQINRQRLQSGAVVITYDNIVEAKPLCRTGRSC